MTDTKIARKPTKWTLAAAATFVNATTPGRDEQQHNNFLNDLLRQCPRRLKIEKVRREGGSYILPITDRKTRETYNIQVPESVRDIGNLKRYFKNITAPLVAKGEITDLVGQPAREAWEGVLELRKQYGAPKELQTYFEFNTQDGLIHGSELRTMILLNKYLSGKGARTLTFQEGMEEDRKGKLSNGVWRDFGVAVYSPAEPHKELAEILIGEAKTRGWELPLLVHPAVLDLSNNGIGIYFAKELDSSLVVSGEQAIEELKKFYWKGDSGVRKLDRISGGYWNSNWNDLFYSDAECRVDKVCGKTFNS